MADIIRVTASDDDVGKAPFTRVCGAWLVGGSDAAVANVYDSLVVAGATIKFSLTAGIAGSSSYVYFPGGIPFKKGISVSLTGTGMQLFLVVE